MISFEQKQLENDHYRAKLNLCIAEGRQMLGSGDWSICIGEEPSMHIKEEVLENLETLSNVFRYDNDKAYIITFHLEDHGESRVSLTLKVDYMMRNPHPKRRIDSLFILKSVLNTWYRFVCFVYKKQGNRVLFLSENREEMTGNLKALYERMIERDMEKTYKLNKSFRNIFTYRQSPLDWLKIVTKIAIS